ncbi:MAG TPA: hypothetical protein VFE51_00030 [Verrucomicrobiae bacterium]|nr:hypothetical protein [Verrucomicrobiae bacterium]
MEKVMRSRARRTSVLICAGVVLLALFFLANLRPNGQTAKLVWIPSSELERHFHPGPFTRLKFKILRLVGPFWRLYMRGRTQVVIETRFVAISSDALQPTALLPSQSYTNADGTLAWILSPEEFTKINRQISMFSESYSIVHALKLITADGGQAQLRNGAPRLGGNLEFIGLRIDLVPTVSEHSFKLDVGAIATAPALLLDGTLAGVVTNLATGCSVHVANGGAVIVQAPAHNALPFTNYWLMVAPSAVDARGNPKSL